MTNEATQTLEHARRVFSTSVPSVDPWTRMEKPVLYAAQGAPYPEAAEELVAAGVLAQAPGSCMWGFYVKGEKWEG